ncbi:hypothetical protein GCM10007989_25690 [Devosia pacifica]|uniref:Phosphoglycerate mutase n=1 Tax=Devosia pacifica TaxID=1335967 RepID=A0A918VVQ6_9HYPH|nr:hypothetical protein GCM10007989_25690 [Devosia pacifica]
MIDGVEIGEFDTFFASMPRGFFRRRDADDIKAIGNFLRQQIDKMPGGRSGAETEAHAWQNLFERSSGGGPFLVVTHNATLKC